MLNKDTVIIIICELRFESNSFDLFSFYEGIEKFFIVLLLFLLLHCGCNNTGRDFKMMWCVVDWGKF